MTSKELDNFNKKYKGKKIGIAGKHKRRGQVGVFKELVPALKKGTYRMIIVLPDETEVILKHDELVVVKEKINGHKKEAK